MDRETTQPLGFCVAFGLLAALVPTWPGAVLARPIFSAEFVSNAIPGTYRSLALADLDGDAIPDLVLPVPRSQEVAIFRGVGDGTFRDEPVLVATGREDPTAVALGDLNGDGNKDLIVAHLRPHRTNLLAVLLGNGDGRFQPPKFYPGSANCYAMATGDLNGDGHLDLVMTHRDQQVSAFLGDGTGALLWTSVVYMNYATPTGVALADFDRDGYLDAAVSNAGALEVTVLRGKGDGTFGPRSDLAVGNGQEALAVGDLNGDDFTDIVTTGVNAHSVAVLLGKGDGTFQPWVDYPTGRYPWDVVVTDLDGDGHADVAVANEGWFDTGEGSLSVLLGNGDGTFGASTQFAGGSARALAEADLDRDGDHDLVLITGRYALALLGNGDGTFGLSFETGGGPYAIAAGDLDGDGRVDLVTSNRTAETVTVFLRRGNGSFARADFPAGLRPGGLAIADLNGDGRLDICVATTYGGTVGVLVGAGDGSFSAPLSYGTAGSGYGIAAADLNRDGILDLVATNGWASSISVLLGNGDGSFEPEVTFAVGVGPTGLAVRDVNSDGFLDLLVCNSGYPDWPLPSHDYPVADDVSVLLGNGDGSFQPKRTFFVGAQPTAVASEDLNADGKLDLAVSSWDGSVSILFGSGDGSFGAATRIEAAFGAGSVTVADFDGDELLDIALTTYFGRAVMVLAGRGDGTFAPAIGFGTRRGPLALTIADLNADAMPDLATVDWDASSVSVLLNRTAPTSVEVTDLAARCTDGATTLTWRLSLASLSELEGIAVQRARAVEGAYMTRAPTPLLPEASMHFRDEDVQLGRHYWYRLLLLLPDGSTTVIGPVEVEGCSSPNVRVAATNGSGGAVEIRYTTGPAAAAVQLVVYDANGRLVRHLIKTRMDAGEYTHTWDSRDATGTRAASGVYFILLEVDRLHVATKLLLLND